MKGRRVLSLVLVVAMLVAFLGVKLASASSGKFADVPSDYWAAKEITYLASNGIIEGFPDGTFKPVGFVTREQFAKIIAVAKKLPLVKPATPTFSDVSPSSWSYPYVEAAVKAGYIKGIGGGKFGPTLGIKRADLAVLLIRVLGKESDASKITEPVCFANDENAIPKYAIGAMTLAYNNHYQLLNYRPGRKTEPLSTATRAEVAKAIYMLLKPPVESDVINLAYGTEPDTLLKPLATVSAAVDVLTFTDAPMVGLNEKEEPFPYAIKEVPSIENGSVEVFTVNGQQKMKMTVHLRKGLKWSDGVPITSADAVFTEKLISDPNIKVVDKTAASNIEKVEAPDDYTIVYYYKQVDPQFVLGRKYLLPAHILKPIYDKNPADINSCSFNQKPVTSGPYMVDEWVKGSYIRLVANPYYPWGQPLIKSVVIKYIPNANTRLANLIAGTLDVTSLNPQQAVVLQNNPKFNVSWNETESGMTYIGVNCENPFLSDKRVRQAIAYAINREEYSKQVYNGKAGLCRGPIMKSSWAFNPNMKVYTYNPDLAMKLLSEAGWTKGSDGILVNKDGQKFIVKFGCTTSADMKTITFIQDNLKQIGIKAEIQAYPITTYYSSIVPRGAVDLYFAGWVEDPLFPGDLLSYRIDQIPTQENGWKGLNWSRWRNEKATQETILASSSLSFEERKKHYYAFQEIFAEEIPEIPWLERIDIVAKRANLVNYVGTKGGVNRYSWNASFWYFEKK